jgi:antitoxin component YwqK of YwqJK toxin-antitoxin module
MMNGLAHSARNIVFFALLVSGACSGPQAVTTHYENGAVASTGTHLRQLRSGPWTDFYKSGKKQSEGTYENDVQTGLWTYWFDNGNKEMEGRFDDERRNGTWKSWYENGPKACSSADNLCCAGLGSTRTEPHAKRAPSSPA